MDKASATEQSLLAELVSEWQRQRAEGKSVTAVQLCHEYPELLPSLEHQLAELESLADDTNKTPNVLSQSSMVQDEATAAFLDPSATMPPEAQEPALIPVTGVDLSGWSDTGLPQSGEPAQAGPWLPETRLTAGPAPADVPEGESPPLALPAVPEVPGYEILGELGRGGMGVVFKARQIQLSRVVALKMILSGGMAGQAELARFRTEGEAIARLQHPNIVQIFEVGEHEGLPFFSLEFCEGGSLSHKLRAGPLLPREAAQLVAQLARAMQLAHQAGIVHRDLKPANILLSGNGTPKVTDFGLAKLLGSDTGQTHTGSIMGTPRYMAPEQASGRTKDVGPATDVYALGVILYEVLTGRVPFLAPTALDTVRKVVTEPPLAPRVLQPNVPRDLETICLKCLEKDAHKRYASSEELAGDLQRWLDGQPILARPVPQWERAWKWARRRPALAALTASVLAALLTATTSAVLYGRLAYHKAAASERETQASREIQKQYIWGQQAEAGREFGMAKDHYLQALTTLKEHPDAAGADMRQTLEDIINRISELLKEQGRLAERQQLGGKLQKFGVRFEEVRFRAVPFRSQDAANDAAAVRKEAVLALKELDLNARSPQLLEQGVALLRQRITPVEQRLRLAEECTEVLLAWADAEAAAAAPAGPTEALRLLDCAAALCRAFGLASPRALHLRRAKYRQALGDAAGARDENQRAAAIKPATALDLFDQALTSYRANSPTSITTASVACARVLQLRPDHFWARYVQALCYLRENRWGEAEVALNVCLGQRRNFVWLFPSLGTAHMELKQYAEAEADFAKALAGSSDPVLRAVALTNRSVLRQRQGRPNDAERDLRQAIALHPKLYQAYRSLADLLKHRDDRAGALKLLDQAQAIKPDDPTIYFDRARLHAENGDRAAAQRDFEQVIAKERPGSKSDQVLSARLELAHLRCLAGEHQAALADCDAVLAVNATLPEAHRQRAEALLGLGGRHKEAGEALERYLEVGGKETPAVHKARGHLLLQQKDYRSAVAAYSQALVLEADAKTLSYRGWAYLKQEAPGPALDDFDAALKLSPKDADALTGRGMALVFRGRAADMAAATAAADKALQAEPRSFTRLMACVRIYSGAILVLQKARNPRMSNDPQTTRYAERALRLLRQAEELLPEKERDTFWRDHVRSDPGLLQLVRSYGR